MHDAIDRIRCFRALDLFAVFDVRWRSRGTRNRCAVLQRVSDSVPCPLAARWLGVLHSPIMGALARALQRRFGGLPHALLRAVLPAAARQPPQQARIARSDPGAEYAPLRCFRPPVRTREYP
jgi:hypothetical protein